MSTESQKQFQQLLALGASLQLLLDEIRLTKSDQDMANSFQNLEDSSVLWRSQKQYWQQLSKQGQQTDFTEEIETTTTRQATLLLELVAVKSVLLEWNQARFYALSRLTDSQKKLREFVDKTPQLKAQNAPKISFINDLIWISGDIITSLNSIVLDLTNVTALNASKLSLEQSFLQFNKTQTALVEGDASRPESAALSRNLLEGIKEGYQQAQGKIDASLEAPDKLLNSFIRFQKLETSNQAIIQRLPSTRHFYAANNLAPWWLFSTLPLSLLLLLIVSLEKRNLLKQLRQDRQDNHKALGRLLDEILGSTKQDLTVQATVSKEPTGALAEAINHIIEQFRNTIINTRATATQIMPSTHEIRAKLSQLNDIKWQYFNEIKGSNLELIDINKQLEKDSKEVEAALSTLNQGTENLGSCLELVTQGNQIADDSCAHIQQLEALSIDLSNSAEQLQGGLTSIQELSQKLRMSAMNTALKTLSQFANNRALVMLADEVREDADKLHSDRERIRVQFTAVEELISKVCDEIKQLIPLLNEQLSVTTDLVNQTSTLIDSRDQVQTSLTSIAAAEPIQEPRFQQLVDRITQIKDAFEGSFEDVSQTEQIIEQLGNQIKALHETAMAFKVPKLPEDPDTTTEDEEEAEESFPPVGLIYPASSWLDLTAEEQAKQDAEEGAPEETDDKKGHNESGKTTNYPKQDAEEEAPEEVDDTKDNNESGKTTNSPKQ